MRWIVNVLKSRLFLMGLGFLMLIVFLLLLGAWLEWSMTVRLLGVIAVLVVGIVALAVSFARANKAASAIEQSIKAQAQQQLVGSRPDKQREIEELQRELERAIEMLKQSKLGKRGSRRQGRAALYALPWYLFIGPPAAGKTTAIANSGLNFPLGTNGLRGVGGTRNCDWFFSDQAILLDTAGRYMTEYDDTEEWLAFLDTLGKHRPERPINGVIVGISIAELASASPEEIEWHAGNIRNRIDELITRLGVRFPVYLLLTKCDLLQGFVEFFGEFSRAEREQIWGCTFSEKEKEQEGAVRGLFEREFSRLYESLAMMRAARLSRSMKREDRRKVYVFPLELAASKERLAHFVDRLFQPNPYQESPIFRGFYFTSGTQEGVPIDRVIQAVAQQVNLPVGHNALTLGSDVQSKAYFIKDVFTDVVIPDQYLAAQTSSSRRQRRFLQAGVGVGAALVLGLFLLGASQALVRSKADLARVVEAAELAAPVEWSGAVALASLTSMDRLREEIDLLEKREENPPWLRMGLYRGSTVLEPARRLYLTRAEAFVHTHAFSVLQRRLQSPSLGTRLEGAAREKLYGDLKTYLLLTSEHGRLEEDANVEWLRAQLVGLAREGTPVLGTEEALPLVEAQIGAYVDGLRAGQAAALEGDARLVTAVRRVIFQPPSVENLYMTIRDRAATDLPPFRLEDAVPAHLVAHFANQPEVPGFFTQEGWAGYVQAAIERESEDPERTEWVMGYSSEDLPASMRDRDAVAKSLEQLYFTEYAARWEQFMRRLTLQPLGDVRTGSRRLAELGNQYDSPILYVLAHVTRQTQFGNEALDDLQERVSDRAERAAEAQVRNRTGVTGAVTGRAARPEEIHPVERRFAGLHALNATAATSGGASPGLYKALQSLASVSELLGGVASGTGADAAEFAAGVIGQNGGALASELQSIQSALGQLDPAVRTALFERPILEAWRAVLGTAQAHLNEAWRAQVVDPFRAQLAGAYPFGTEMPGASVLALESYFHPESGAVATFTGTELQPFLGRDGSPRTWQGQGIRVSPAARRAIDGARQIARGLFSGGTLRIDFELQPDVPDREGTVAPVDAVSINIHGKEDTYRMGSYRPWTAFSWPGGSDASLMVSTRQGSATVAQFEGEWAVLQLLQQAEIRRTSSSEFDVRWAHAVSGEGRIVVRYALRARNAADLFNDPRGFFSYQVPESLE